MSSLALVLGGGGVRGAYQVGAIKAFKELGIEFDIITSTSVGCLNSVLLIQNELAKLLDIWENINFETITDHKYRIKNKSLELLLFAPLCNGFSMKSLESLLDKNIDEDLIRNSKTKMGIVITQNPKKYSPYTLEKIPDGQLKNYILTSCSAWPFLKKRKIEGKICYDGYYSDNLPIKLAREMGAKKIIAIDVLQGFRKRIKNKKIYYFKLKSKHFFLNFENELIKELIELGYDDVMRQKNEIIRYINSI